ncbi:hypothetical protein [Pseudoalteromonas sp. SR43-5]|uniref:hypothetical protein n=1 Tax=Pseudoalteromonas sp. SR43-5 TaxID=2760941 RepID=UPI0015F78A40|nr:hypothetical protein [Pseudoalteromonas sp. SR43-5]MBB1307259.1 hypothetical protein [Pseudoalteromonas sp. SR43-5]
MWPFSKIKQQQHTIFAFNQKITEQQKTINELDEKIKQLVLGEITVEELSVKNNELNGKFKGKPLQFLAESFVDQFKNGGAKNYLEMEFWDQRDEQKYKITMQRSNGLTSSQKAKKLTGLLERSICGFEYIRDNHNKIWVTANDEFLAELKAAVEKP